MTQFHCFEYIENHGTPISNTISNIRRIRKLSPFEHNAILGSVNGLICLSDLINRFCICNPRTREYIVLPKRTGESGWYYNWVGFGYLPSADQYKVVVVNELKKEPKYIEIMVYTVGSGNGWRNIGKFNRIFNYVSPEHGIFADGALHWKDHGDIVWVFDLADEKFCAKNNHSKYLKINNYNPKACTWKTLVDFKRQFCQVFAHSITLVSLRGLGEGARIFKKRKRRD
ncbi:uncharacterized protein LOC113344354 [Papaver somniferum]|uniref:uncharacterized protein LOC113344354 n=1 Tax=Papaver somniferum TaxID=3469 RepID=UPI000E6FC7F8|nr:uncharacterized protein LOC113344354 [Papaver somniferum]